MDRLEKICSYLDECQTLADVGCDHGYCTLQAFNSGKCKSAYISDVSEKCLAKAKTLLKDYIERGVCKAVCCDGLKDIPKDCEQVLIAGMGGMEIIKILSEGFIPKKFVLQPMRNCQEVRKFLLEKGCAITADDVFSDGKFYFIIKGERLGQTQPYSPYELSFGRDSLKNPVFKEFALQEIGKAEGYLNACTNAQSAKTIQNGIDFLKEAVSLYDL
ncbi:MAG: tRNA (adenine(22)-N(1))-methyltransferase [Candidatus Coproplasma sp.]